MKRYFLPVGALALALLIGAGTFVVHAKETRGTRLEKDGEAIPGSSIACVDMELVYNSTGGPEGLMEQERIRDAESIRRIKMIIAAPYLEPNELEEFGTIVGKDKPTPQDEIKLKSFKETSDKRAEELKTLQTKVDLTDQERARLTQLTQARQRVEQMLPDLQADFRAQQTSFLEAYRHKQYANLRVEVGKVAKERGITHVFDTNSLVYSANDLTPLMLQKLKRPVK